MYICLFVRACVCVKHLILVYDILPPTTATVDYAIGPEKLSANEHFFHDTQTAVSLCQIIRQVKLYQKRNFYN